MPDFWSGVGDVLVSGLEKKIDAEIGGDNVGNQAQYDETYNKKPQQDVQPNGEAIPSGLVSLGGVQLNKVAVVVAAGALGVALIMAAVR